MQIQVDVRSPTPHYEQIRAQVTRLVLTGALPSGTRLPPIRQLAGHLGLSNGAVARAYRELEREGTVVTAGKRGTTVADRPVAGTEDDVAPPSHAAERRRVLDAAAAEYATTAHRLGCSPEQTRAALEAVLTADLGAQEALAGQSSTVLAPHRVDPSAPPRAPAPPTASTPLTALPPLTAP